jgi:hypothetical protein
VRRFPLRDSTGSTLMDVYRAASGKPEEAERAEVSVIGSDEVERVLSNWESTVSDQLGRKVPFKRHREFSDQGHTRYVSSNKAVDAVAVLEDGTYSSTALVNRARFGITSAVPMMPPGTRRG